MPNALELIKFGINHKFMASKVGKDFDGFSRRYLSPRLDLRGGGGGGGGVVKEPANPKGNHRHRRLIARPRLYLYISPVAGC